MIHFSFKPLNGQKASDIGFLLHKNPHRGELSFRVTKGQLKLTFTINPDDTALEMRVEFQCEPELLHKKPVSNQPPLAPYLSTRGFVLDSLMASALQDVFGTTLAGNLEDTQWKVTVKTGPMKMPESRVQSILDALGYTSVYLTMHHDNPFLLVETSHPGIAVTPLLRQWVVLMRACSEPHAFLEEANADQLRRYGEGWLSDLPVADRTWLIRKVLPDRALQARLEQPDTPHLSGGIGGASGTVTTTGNSEPSTVHFSGSVGGASGMASTVKSGSLDARVCAITDLIRGLTITQLVEFGCHDGKMASLILESNTDLVYQGFEPSPLWHRAQRRLEKMGKRARVDCRALGYASPKLSAPDTTIVMAADVIEHIPLANVPAALQTLLQTEAAWIVLTTPNKDYNHLLPEPDQMRHPDHKWEFSRVDFRRMVEGAVAGTQYAVERWLDIGEQEHPELGRLTQGVLLRRSEAGGKDWPVLPKWPERVQEQQAFWDFLQTGQPIDAIPYIPETISPVSGGAMKALRDQADEAPVLPDQTNPLAWEYCHPAFLLEHPEAAFAQYERAGIKEVMVQQKHMGSRAIAVVTETGGTFYSRTGRNILAESLSAPLLATLRKHAPTLPAIFDGELLPWSLKASGLLDNIYLPLCHVAEIMEDLPSELHSDHTAKLLDALTLYREQVALYVRSETPSYAIWNCYTRTQPEGMTEEQLGGAFWHQNIPVEGSIQIRGTPTFWVQLNNARHRAEAVRWWWALAQQGAEGVVIKPVVPPTLAELDRIPPALKVRNPAYLTLVYGPRYMEFLDRLKDRKTAKKLKESCLQAGYGLQSRTYWFKGLVEVAHTYVLRALVENPDLDPRL